MTSSSNPKKPNSSNEFIAYPFLKWVGGKGQLLNTLEENLPAALKAGRLKKYFEPMAGGAALFFLIAQKYKVSELYLSDLNADLILAYKTIQNYSSDLINYLAEIQAKYHKLNDLEQSAYFYNVRTAFNSNKSKLDYLNMSKDWVEHTAQLLFLNRTCFNGLYRVNSKGLYNVPFGRYKNPNILYADNLKAISEILQHTEIKEASYKACYDLVDDSSFVYFDPPYRPLSKTAKFTTYANTIFDDKAQLELAEFFKQLNEKKAYLMLSNSDPKNTDPSDDFIDQAYSPFHIKRVSANRMINCNAQKRGGVTEVLIKNYTQ